MAVNKNFVVKNGIEVATDLIFASSDLDKVGIGSTIPTATLEVGGDAKLTGNTELVGVTTLSSSGGITTTGGDLYVGSNLSVDGHTELDDLNVSGVSTFVGITTVESTLFTNQLNVAGVSTFNDIDVRSFTANFGTSTGSQIVINGNGGSITKTNGNLTLYGGGASGSEVGILNNSNIYLKPNTGGVELYYGKTDKKLETTGYGVTVFGGLNVSGVSSVGSAITMYGSTGIISATTFYGDGSNLSNITASSGGSLGFSTSGSVGYGITLLNFVGTGVSDLTTPVSGIATLTILGGGGGSASIGIGTTVGDAFSGIVTTGNLWYNTDEARLFIYYDDGSSSQWVDAAPFNIGIITSGLQSLAQGTALSPSLAFSGDSSTGLFSPASGEQTFVSVGSSILNVNPSGIEVTGVSSVGSAITMYGNTGVVSATSFYGDGSNLSGITAGATLSAGSGDQRVVLTSLTSGTMTSAATDAELTYNSDTDTLNVGNVSIGGTLTYEDVTNVDSIGVITARSGINVSGIVTAISGIVTYYGDGSQLTGISAGISTTASSPSANTTVTLDLSAAQHHDLTLSAGITTITCTGGNFGESHSVVITQPSSGIATIGFSTYFLFPSGSTPSMSEGGGSIDLISFVVKRVGTAGTQLLASAGLNYQ